MVAIKIIPVNFLYVIYLQKELDKTSFGLYIIALQMYREILNKYRKKAFTHQKHIVQKNIVVLEPSQAKSNFVPKYIQFGYKMAEKKE